MKEKAPKGTSKDKKTKEAEPRDAPKPKPRAKKPEVIPEPPIFEKVVTRLGHEEAEQRMAVRISYIFVHDEAEMFLATRIPLAV